MSFFQEYKSELKQNTARTLYFTFLFVGTIGLLIATIWAVFLIPNPKGWVTKTYSDICKPQYFNGQNIDIKLE